jgi:hypothetical protein
MWAYGLNDVRKGWQYKTKHSENLPVVILAQFEVKDCSLWLRLGVCGCFEVLLLYGGGSFGENSCLMD